MKIIIKNNKTIKLETEDLSLIGKISKLLSYKQSGVEYTQAYKNGWDGLIRLLNKKNECGIGLLFKIKDYLTENNIEYVIEDKRKSIKLEPELVVNDIGFTLRDYQERIVNTCKDNNIGIIRAATASGKTYCSAYITKQFNKPTIIYVIGLDLLQQFHDLYSKIFKEEIGWIGNGICNPKRITIASVWTLGSALEVKKASLLMDDEYIKELPPSIQDKFKILKCLKEAKVHIIDECHACTCDTLQQIYKYIDPERIYGLSGTPFRDDGSDLLTEAMLGKIICNVSASELIEKKVLAQPVIKFINVPGQVIHARTFQEVYKEYVVNNEIRNALILKNTKDLIDRKYKPLVLFKTIEHGKKLYNDFISNGINCDLLYGNDSLEKRNIIKQKLNDGEIDCIIASTIFDIGMDLPKLSALVLCGGGKSKVRTLQRVGRVIRAYKDKTKAAIIDFMDNTRFLDKHSLIRYQTYIEEEGFKILGK
jgi:superfamily II DNA or RNA helicase